MSTKTKETAISAPVQTTSTGLAIVSKNEWLSMQDGSELREAIEANMASGEAMTESILTRVKTPTGGGTNWTINDPEGERTTKEIEGILVYNCPRGVLWPSTNPVPGTMPVAVSHDLKTAEQFGPIPKDMEAEMKLAEVGPKLYDWTKLARTYGMGAATRELKRAKEQRVMFVLTKESAWPLVIAAQPGSLKTVLPFVRKLSLPHWRCIISLSLVKARSQGGQDYAQIVPKLVGCLSREDGEIVKAMYHNPIKGMASKILTEDLDNSDE